MEQKQQDPFLFILLGFDTLYSINLNHLHLKKEDLQIVFSHKTHKQPGSRNHYPVGMGLFVHNSKLHFFGGENFDADASDYDQDDGFQNIQFEIRRNRPPKNLDYFYALEFLYKKNWDEWNWDELTNTKVFSFNPILKLDQPPALSLVPNYSSTPLIIPPEASSYKMRPIVFTISDKVYALSTRPYNASLMDNAAIKGKKDVIFEVFEPCKWQWTKLPEPPAPLNTALSSRQPIYHCVFKDQLLLQTRAGDFIFDVIQKKWFRMPHKDHDVILASLKFKNQLLLFFGGGGGYLVAYDLDSFEEYKNGFSFWKSSLGAVWEDTIFYAGPITEDSGIWGASLSIVDDNSICLVLNCYIHLYVCHFEFIKPPCEFSLKAHKRFYLPPVMFDDPHTLSSFVLREGDEPRREGDEPRREGDFRKSNQDSTVSTTGTLILQSKSHLRKIPFVDEGGLLRFMEGIEGSVSC